MAKFCEKCGERLDDQNDNCPLCNALGADTEFHQKGYIVDSKKDAPKKRNKLIVISVLFVTIAALIVSGILFLPKVILNIKINQSASEYTEVTDICETAISKYADDNGLIALSDREKVLNEIYAVSNDCVQQGLAKEIFYNPGDTGVVVELSSGIRCFYAPVVDGYMSGVDGSNTAEIISIEPYDNTFNDTWDHIGNHLVEWGYNTPGDIAKDLAEEFDFLSPGAEYKGLEGSVNSLLSIKSNSIVIWRGHGGYNKEGGGSLLGVNSDGGLLLNAAEKENRALLAREVIKEHYSALKDHSLVLLGDGEKLAVTSKFFESMPDKCLENSLIYLAACDSIMDCYDDVPGGLAESLIKKGAVAVVGNSGIINAEYNAQMLHSFFEALAVKYNGDYITLEESLNNAKALYGATDPNNEATAVNIVCPEKSPDNRHKNLPYFYGPSSTVDGVIAEEKAVIVEDALYYEKDMIATESSREIGWTGEGLKHKVKIPRINLNTPNVEEINQRIYDSYSKIYEGLIADQEKDLIYDVDYQYKEYNGLIGIIIKTGFGVQCGGVNMSYHSVYYNTNNDIELSFQEYIKALGFTEQELNTQLSYTDEYIQTFSWLSGYGDESASDYVSVVDCIMDSEGTIVIFNDMSSMDGCTQIETKSFLDKIVS